ncbi:hypothetical protein CHAB381_0482 [Campylobacter hominis ATCC BAA-381]|uniref:Uncharacterized protein n=1 Tax=Campylobacter hominis (strain ATCC BAA-381 / DSM 21671 / CCUG 45161 / LMG 19568 / NCTC 13146 / CH001A) TaxID=360107 RepID=A7I0M9_CAMHC|nr:hypothetical protein CHAB381_0482 [Campylobacter hominis ATCC BAA-381]
MQFGFNKFLFVKSFLKYMYFLNKRIKNKENVRFQNYF